MAEERQVRSPTGWRTGLVPLLALALLLPLVAGCATKGDVRDLQRDMRTLTARQDSALAELDRLARRTQETLQAQSDVIFSLRGDLNRQILQIQDQLVTLQELSGQSQRTLANLRDQIETQRAAVHRQMEGELPRVEGMEGEGLPEEGAAGETYNAAVTQFNRGSFTTARRAFEQFLEQNPGHRLAPDAHYYLAEIRVQQDDLEAAVEGFLRVPELFPTSHRVPDAYYRVGVLMEELGNPSEARDYLERVVNSYPDSRVAPLARERLEEIR